MQFYAFQFEIRKINCMTFSSFSVLFARSLPAVLCYHNTYPFASLFISIEKVRILQERHWQRGSIDSTGSSTECEHLKVKVVSRVVNTFYSFRRERKRVPMPSGSIHCYCSHNLFFISIFTSTPFYFCLVHILTQSEKQISLLEQAESIDGIATCAITADKHSHYR